MASFSGFTATQECQKSAFWGGCGASSHSRPKKPVFSSLTFRRMRLNALPMPGGIPGIWFFELIYWQGFQDNGRGGGEGSGRGGGRACARKALRAQARARTRALSGPPRNEEEPARVPEDEKQVKGAFGARLRVRCPRCRHRQKNGVHLRQENSCSEGSVRTWA